MNAFSLSLSPNGTPKAGAPFSGANQPAAINRLSRISAVLVALLLLGQVHTAVAQTFTDCPTSPIVVPTDPGLTCGAVVTYTAPATVAPGGGLTSQSFGYAGGIQNWTVPTGVTTIHVDAYGAQGGSVSTTCPASGGLGARISGDLTVVPGSVLSILVGQQGVSNGSDGGGGGGSFVVGPGNTPLIIAGGGGGATNNITTCGANRDGINASVSEAGTASADGLVAGGTAGNGGGANTGGGGGGGGFNSNGVNFGGQSFLNGGAGGTGGNNDNGGFGGGGSGWHTGGNGGGGGGYSGGGTNGVQPYSGGGGGGSFNAGHNPVNQAGANAGNGSVVISYNGVVISQTAGLASGATFPLGTTTNTYISSNGATCSFDVTVNAPEIDLQGGATLVSIPDGATNMPAPSDFTLIGTVAPGGTVSQNFTIKNTGNGQLNIDNIFSSDHTVFVVSAIPASVAASTGTGTFEVAFKPTVSGPQSAMITVESNDCSDGEGTYTFNVGGMGGSAILGVTAGPAAAAPGQPIASGDLTPEAADGTLFVSAPSGTVRTASYTLTNSGLLPLNISGITFSGPGAGFCSVVSAPTSIGAGVTLTDALVIRYTAIGAGIYTATVNITSNALASPYTFSLQGSSTSTGCN